MYSPSLTHARESRPSPIMDYMRAAVYPALFEIPAHLMRNSRVAIYRVFRTPHRPKSKPRVALFLRRAPKPSPLRAPCHAHPRSLAFVKDSFVRFYDYCHSLPIASNAYHPRILHAVAGNPLKSIAPPVNRGLRSCSL